MLSEFVEKVSVVDEYERPDAEECLRILMKLLYKIPSNGADRLNALMEKVMEVVDDLSSPMDDIARRVLVCIIKSSFLSCWLHPSQDIAQHGTGNHTIPLSSRALFPG